MAGQQDSSSSSSSEEVQHAAEYRKQQGGFSNIGRLEAEYYIRQHFFIATRYYCNGSAFAFHSSIRARVN